MPDPAVHWVFDELPPSGARRGGDPSEHAFKHDLETFVREVVQNANDQALGFPAVRFAPVELRGPALADFLDAIDWATLQPHVRAAAVSRGGGALGEFLAGLEQRKRLLLLHIEDRNTAGLAGDESEGESHFRALCKDTLYSHKRSESAGGSYGLGKSVLWSFSGLSTVLFNSVLLEDPEGQRSPRLIGRVELPSHAVADGRLRRWYTGSGWFGQVQRGERGARAESVWAPRADALARRLHIARESRNGTSIAIVGFRDPAGEGDEDAAELSERIGRAATRYFWPAMAMETRRLRLSVMQGDVEQLVTPETEPLIAPFLACYRARGEQGGALVEPGDIAVRRIAIELPDTRTEPQGTGEVDLVVRLAEDGKPHPLAGQVALFRGPGMVVRYWDRSALALGARPFHAVLVCGEARSPLQPSAADHKVERFLRAAEPPGHDDWVSTPALKQQYKRGYARALQRLKDSVNEELRRLLLSRPALGGKGPERLQRRFPIGGSGGRGGAPSAFHFSGLRARFDGGCWRFSGSVRPERAREPWRAELVLQELGDGGEVLGTLEIAQFGLQASDARSALHAGAARIEAPASVTEVAFEGASAKAAGPVAGELGLEITGALGEDPS